MHGRWKVVWLAALSIAMFMLFIGRRQFATSHEARVAQVAREMAADGWPWNATAVQVNRVHLVRTLGVLRLSPDYEAPPMRVNAWVVPILSGEVRLQKPPLPYWCAAILFRLTGVTEGAARFVPALLGALATVLLFDLTRMLYGRKVAWIAALIWPTTYLIVDDYRLAMADPYLAFFTLAAVWSWVRASLGESIDKAGSKRPSLFVLLFYVCVALGALAKGPLIFLHAVIPIIAFHICFRWRVPRGLTSHLIGVILFLAVALPWPLAVMHQVPNAMQLWRYESVGEISGENQEGLRAWWYYLLNLPLLAMPWVALWVCSLLHPFRNKRATVLFPILWYGFSVLFFTVVGQKKLPYLLPIMPAQVMMIAIAAVELLHAARRRERFRSALVWAQVIIGIGWAIVLPVLIVKQHAVGVVPLAAAGTAIVLAIWAAWTARSGGSTRWLVWQTLAYAAILLVFNNIVQTATANNRSPKPVCQELSAVAAQSHAAILVDRLPEEAAFYLPLHPNHAVAPRVYLVMVDDATGVNYRAKRKLPEPPPDVEHFEGWVPDAKLVGVRRVALKSAPGDARWKVYELTVERSALASADARQNE
jgi:4-amino-4-deoxy-L-arabinose transferase-like glycosyltransferase